MSNFGWVPRSSDEHDKYLNQVALLVARRPAMDMIEIASTLQGFIEEATSRAAAPPPIDDELVVGGHAGRRGFLSVDPYPGSVGPWLDFESLERSLAVPGLTLGLPDALVGYSPATPQSTARAFHIKGCNIGKARPWLEKLREALGNHVRVSAPKHFHGVSINGLPAVTPLDVIEWMGYQFVAYRKTPFADVDALATAFYAQGHIRPDGARIPKNAFKTWLRVLGVRKRQLKVAVQIERKNLPLPLGRNIGGLVHTDGEMGFYTRTPASSVVYQTFVIQPPQPVPATDAECEAMLPAWFQTDTAYLDTHPFPIYRREGYATLAEMIDGLKWRFVRNATVDPPTIDCIGGRFEYELLVPIANPGPGGTFAPTKAPLIYNHIPESGPPVTTPAFDETSPYYYATVP